MATYQERLRLQEMHYQNLTAKTTLPDAEDAEKLALKNMLQSTLTSNLFFSKKNVEAMHDEIIKRVKTITGKDISRQSEHELFLVMRSVYLQYSNNDPSTYVEEVRWLNGKVLEYVVPNIVVNMQHYLKYLEDIDKVPVPMDRAPNMSSKGSRSLMFNHP